MSYNSKYTGKEVEELLDSIESKQDNIPVVDNGAANTSITINPNVYYKWGVVSELNISLNESLDGIVYNEFLFQFSSGAIATTICVPSSVKWQSEPNIEANKTYQVSIVNNIGLIVGV